MTPVLFFRLSLTLPLLLPATVFLLVGVEYKISFWMLMSLALGGIPYLLLVPWAFWGLGRCRSEVRVVGLMVALPVCYLLPLVACLGLSLHWYGHGDALSECALVFSGAGLGVGYAYVVLVLAVYSILRGLGGVTGMAVRGEEKQGEIAPHEQLPHK